MNLLGKKLKDIDYQDIVSLQTNKTPESMILEYKQKLPGNSDGERKEFLADVSAFANTSGGIIIYGIAEGTDQDGKNTGFPSEIVGIGKINREQERQRLEAMIRDGLDPRLNGINFEYRDDKKEKVILLLGIPRSLSAPHMVWLGRSGKFFMRSSTSKYQLDVNEVRKAFLETEAWEQTADRFRRERVMQVRSLEFLPNLDVDGSYFLHILPLGTNRRDIDIVSHAETLRLQFKPPFMSGWNTRFNLDGYLLENGGEMVKSYVQWFRNGGIEVYTSVNFYRDGRDQPLNLHGGKTEFMALEYLKKYLQFASQLEVEPPFAVFLTLIGMRGGRMLDDKGDWFSDEIYTFVKDEIVFPSVIINGFEDNPLEALQPIFNRLWQAIGRSRSPYKRDDKSSVNGS